MSNITRVLRRAYCQQIKSSTPSTAASANPSTQNVMGLSSKCLQSASKECKDGYKVPEYFQFHRFSYTEAEIEMAKYRCPQPSAVKK